MSDLVAIARTEAQIEAHYEHPIRSELSPHKSDSKARKADYATRLSRWHSQLDVLTAELRALKAPPVEGVGERVFPNDIANSEALARFEFAKRKQLDGVIRSFGRPVK